MSATEVSFILEEAGIIDDRKRFLDYVVSRQAASLLKERHLYPRKELNP